MSILAIGINHKTASIVLREKMYFALDKLSLYLQDLLNSGLTQEAVLLSTCNRSELYCEAEDLDGIRDWFASQTTASKEELASSLYIYKDEEAVAHIMQVACGLDSMVLGEPQILGQMKEAFSESCTVGAVDSLFHRLFQQVFTTAKEIRTATEIGACPVSVVSAALSFAKQHYAALTTNPFTAANVVLIGAGETGELLLRYLKTQGIKSGVIVNRHVEKAKALAKEWGGQACHLDDISAALTHADIIFSATGSALPIVTEGMVAEALNRRQPKPLLMIDIAVPRDIDPAVAELPQAHLYCIDDLMAIIASNRQGREHAALKAKEMIHKKSMDFITELHSFERVSHTISAYRGQIEAICRAELMKAKWQLQQGNEASDVLDAFAQAFIKKLLHAPSVQLRQAGAEGRFELLNLAKQLFALPDPEVERL